MRCPVDEETVVIIERQGIEIDYCPRCRGVWLDRGELDKLIEREADRYESGPYRGDRDDRGERSDYGMMPRRERDHDWDDDDHHRYGGHGHKRKKKGFLSEMFEFD